ncbi:sigma factor-like helix-turn-helix DNA-binding protein [Sorangium sp. So ce296]|uniref:sigma factor-like helix-turn-helix DNA-binding protein n=1 Tax=Sorangium sp. So ce296 TaxID=3133296 RepID=UPI003F64418F
MRVFGPREDVPPQGGRPSPIRCHSSRARSLPSWSRRGSPRSGGAAAGGPRERAVLVLVGTGEAVTEVARVLGVPVGTAFTRLRRGRRRLAAVLARWGR